MALSEGLGRLADGCFVLVVETSGERLLLNRSPPRAAQAARSWQTATLRPGTGRHLLFLARIAR